MIITKDQFRDACDALWTEIEYQNSLDRRTEEGEAKEVPAFCVLGRRYIRMIETEWADQPADEGPHVSSTLDGMRKVAAIFVRGMIYCGIKYRKN